MKHEMHVLGIDIAKRVFHAAGMDDRGNIVYRKRLSRHDLMPCIAKHVPPSHGVGVRGLTHGPHRAPRHACAVAACVSSAQPHQQRVLALYQHLCHQPQSSPVAA